MSGISLDAWSLDEKESLELALFPRLDYLPMGTLSTFYAFQLGKFLLGLLLLGMEPFDDILATLSDLGEIHGQVSEERMGQVIEKARSREDLDEALSMVIEELLGSA